MDYQKHYSQLIENAQGRILEGYTEIHHIVPRCLGGSNQKDNLVQLTAREHFIAHLLLVKIYPKNSKLIFAAHMMTVSNDQQCRNNRRYDWLRTQMSLAKKGKSQVELYGFDRAEQLRKANIERQLGISYIEKYGEERAQELKRINSELNKGKAKTEDHKEKIRNSLKGHIISEETKQKIRLAHIGKVGNSIQKSSKRIRCIELGVEFDSLKQAAKYINLSNGSGDIREVALGRRKTAGGYTWEFI